MVKLKFAVRFRIVFKELVGLANSTSSEKSFAVRFEMLPSYLPPRIAEKILFVGESVQIFSSRKKTDFFTSQGKKEHLSYSKAVFSTEY